MATKTTAAMCARLRRPRTYRPRPGDLIAMNGKTYRVATPQMLEDFAAVEAGRMDDWETVDAGPAVSDLLAALDA